MSTVRIPDEQRLRLSCVPWETYVLYSDGLGPRHIRVTYDRGEMEIMTLGSKHENNKRRLAKLIDMLTVEMNIAIASYGSMTCRREEMLRGLEPDDLFWIRNEQAVRGREDIDLNVDPPPDLAIEVEISRSSLDRMAIYAALQVQEVWRWDGKKLRVCLLNEEETYDTADRSQSFPFLPLDSFVKFLTRTGMNETELVRAFRKWVREQIAAGWPVKKGKKGSR